MYNVNDSTFTDIALKLFRFQAAANPVYQQFLHHLRCDPDRVTTLTEIPFLPISFFKQHLLQSGSWTPTTFYTSSGTTGMATSRHAVQDEHAYLQHARRCFEHVFGSLRDYHFLALLPSYLERQGSSLIAMMDYFIRESGSSYSGFYLYDMPRLLADIETLRHDGRKTILWGVSFALLDMAEQHPTDLSHALVFETGGMKGRRREITRAELHDILRQRLGVQSVYSEYGMTELFSQAYTRGGERFYCSPAMRMVGREITDPLHKGVVGETAALNVIDLANWSTIAFIETEDLGRVHADGSFEVLGRMDNSDVRGCNLLIA